MPSEPLRVAGPRPDPRALSLGACAAAPSVALPTKPKTGRWSRVRPPCPAPARPSGRRPHLDKTSRSSSADSSLSRVLLPPAAPEPPPGRSFSFSPLEDAAILRNGPACAQLRAGVERRARQAEGRVTEAGDERWAGAPPVLLEVPCGLQRHLLGSEGFSGLTLGARAKPRTARGSIAVRVS